MRRAVTARAGLTAEGTVSALGDVAGGLFVAGGALYLRNFRWMRELLDVRVAGGATYIGVNAGLVLRRIHVDAATLFGFQVRLAMAGEAIGVRDGASTGRFLGASRAERKRQAESQ